MLRTSPSIVVIVSISTLAALLITFSVDGYAPVETIREGTAVKQGVDQESMRDKFMIDKALAKVEQETRTIHPHAKRLRVIALAKKRITALFAARRKKQQIAEKKTHGSVKVHRQVRAKRKQPKAAQKLDAMTAKKSKTKAKMATMKHVNEAITRRVTVHDALAKLRKATDSTQKLVSKPPRQVISKHLQVAGKKVKPLAVSKSDRFAMKKVNRHTTKVQNAEVMQARLRVQRAEITTLRGKAKLAKMKMRLMQIKNKMKAKIKRAEVAAHRAHVQLAKMKIKYAKLAKQTRTNIKAVIRAAVVKVQKAQLHAAKQGSMKDLKKDLLKHMQVMVTKRLKENVNRRVAADKSLTHLQKTNQADNKDGKPVVNRNVQVDASLNTHPHQKGNRIGQSRKHNLVEPPNQIDNQIEAVEARLHKLEARLSKHASSKQSDNLEEPDPHGNPKRIEQRQGKPHSKVMHQHENDADSAKKAALTAQQDVQDAERWLKSVSETETDS